MKDMFYLVYSIVAFGRIKISHSCLLYREVILARQGMYIPE